MENCQIDFILHARDIILNSGRYLFRKGKYYDCIEDSALKYSVIEFGVDEADAGVNIGLCLPRSCPDAVIIQKLDLAFQKLQLPYNVFSIYSDADKFSVETTWLTYFTLIIISILILVTIWSSFNKKSNKVVKAFDFGKNMEHFKIRQNQDLNIFDGVRAISMMWVVIGHVYSFFLSSGVQNILQIQRQANKPIFLIIEVGLISVDIFFMLGGFFLAFVFLRLKKNDLLKYPLGILQRALRIWPAYILTIIFYYSIFMQLGKGPLWYKIQPDVQMCSTMWQAILFINNLVDNGKILCLGWSWYLQVDFQLFLICLFVLFVYSQHKVTAYIFCILFMCASLAYNYVYTFNHQIRLFTDLSAFANFEDFMLDVYTKPWGRCTPYLIGLLLGIFYMDFRNNKNNFNSGGILMIIRNIFVKNRLIRVIVEWSGIAIMSFLTFIPRVLQQGAIWPQSIHSLYWSFSKPLFIIGLILTILPSILGLKHSLFNLLLTPRLFSFIARISFCTYLVHLIIIYQFIFTRTYDIYYNPQDMFIIYMGILIVSLFFGFWLTMLVEIPFANLQKQLIKMLTKRGSIQRQVKQQNRLKQSLISQDQMNMHSINLITNKQQQS